MLGTLQSADIAGIRAFAVQAKDEEARRFYLKFFIFSLSDPMRLSVFLKEVRLIVSGRQAIGADVVPRRCAAESLE